MLEATHDNTDFSGFSMQMKSPNRKITFLSIQEEQISVGRRYRYDIIDHDDNDTKKIMETGFVQAESIQNAGIKVGDVVEVSKKSKPGRPPETIFYKISHESQPILQA